MSIKYRPEIDGVRAIAVLSVVLFHAGFSFMHRGFLGVDIFFVISGYLISSIILKDLDKGGFSFAKFYDHRVRRILPALTFVILVTIPFAIFFLDVFQFDVFARSVFATFFFIANFFFASVQSDYWATGTELSPMLHMWSLAVEEQFYIFFPFILIVCFKFKRTTLSAVILALIILSLGISIFYGPSNPTYNFYMLTSRFWELAAGALIVVMGLDKKKIQPKLQNIFALIGLILIVYSLAFVPIKNTFPGIATVPVIIGTCLVLTFAKQNTFAGKFFSWKPFVAIGLLSYSFYLWHQPFFVFMKYAAQKYDVQTLLAHKLSYVVAILVCLALSWFSWKFIEQPFRRPKQFKYRTVFSSAGFVVIVFVLGLSLYDTFFISSTKDKILLETYGQGAIINDCNGNFTEKCATSEKPELVFWGDSFAGAESDMISMSLSAPNFALITMGACFPFFTVDGKIIDTWAYKEAAPKCKIFKESIKPYILAHPSIKYIVLVSPFLSEEFKEFADKKQANDPNLYKTDIYIVANETIQWIKQQGIIPIIIRPAGRRVEQHSPYDFCAMQAVALNQDASKCRFTRQEADEAFHDADVFIDTFADQVAVLNLRDLLCDKKWCDVVVDNVPLYYDVYGHFTQAGAQAVGKKFDIYQKLIDVGVAYKQKHKM